MLYYKSKNEDNGNWNHMPNVVPRMFRRIPKKDVIVVITSRPKI